MGQDVAAKADTTEFRLDVPLELAAMVDARVAYLGRGASRTTVVVDLIRQMAEDEIRRAKLVERLARGSDLWGRIE